MVKQTMFKRSMRPRSVPLAYRPVRIPQITASVNISQVFRFTATSTMADLTITRGDILNLLQVGIVSGAAGNTARLMRGAKINKLEVYMAPTAAGTNNFNLTWHSQFGCPKTLSMSTLGSAEIGYLNSRPPRDSAAELWSVTGTNETEVLFAMDVPISTVIDIHVTWQLQDFTSESPVPVIAAGNATTISGIVGVRDLDGTGGVLGSVGWLGV